MRRPSMLACVAGLLVTACTSGPESTIEVPDETTLTTATIVLPPQSGDPVSTASTVPTDVVTPITAAEPTTTTSTSTTTTTPPPDEPAAPSPAPATTIDDAPIGDGPVLVDPPGDGETPPVGDGLAPVFFNFAHCVSTTCEAASIGAVTLQWEVVGAESVTIAVNAESQVYRLGEPPAGSLEIPLDCTDGSIYYVIAENPGGRTVRSAAVAP